MDIGGSVVSPCLTTVFTFFWIIVFTIEEVESD